MPLEVLIALVVCGIAGIAILTHLFGLSSRSVFEDEAAARAAWLREFPQLSPGEVTLATDRHAALVTTRKGPGLVWSFGADTTARLLTGARVSRDARGLVIRLPDYSAPRIRLSLDDDEAARWTTLTGDAA
ncbi:hypothetical protein ROJ8625_00854 [Roseivivax jejudonensis]|uniref:Uncharacterized protein n=1 Tax=Roseivivax jejudonensis TaxID=1529041 RepID=A0A1X6YIQ4_9RHOB|nr:hypothetical protein [Roseivivax jejudonensis]SLN22030.1 hypothetical protein ROJ8625_00854 [Roseivivax jejudonensis]